MQFDNIVIAGLSHVDAPHRIASVDIERKLAPVLEGIGLPEGFIEALTGIVARRWWDAETRPSDAATLAARKVLDEVGVSPERIGLLVNTSVCRDYVEPSTACLVHGNLGLPPTALNYDLGNACLGFLNGMELAAHMLQAGSIDYALIVDGESSRFVQEKTIERMLSGETKREDFESQFATFTLGSGGAAMLLTRRELAPEGHRFVGVVSRAATEHSRLCWGQVDRMFTDTRKLLVAGIQLAAETLAATREALGWRLDELDHLILHQVSKSHTEKLCKTLELPIDRVFRSYPELGNVGPAAVPITLSKCAESGRIQAGDRVALMGIGSGLNCAMAEIIW